MKHGDIRTIELFTKYKVYLAYITSTVAMGKQSEQLREIQKVALTYFQHCTENMKAGLKDQEVDKLMRDILIESGYNKYSGTGTGHGIGLEVHEKPLFSVQSEKVLQSGMRSEARRVGKGCIC